MQSPCFWLPSSHLSLTYKSEHAVVIIKSSSFIFLRSVSTSKMQKITIVEYDSTCKALNCQKYMKNSFFKDIFKFKVFCFYAFSLFWGIILNSVTNMMFQIVKYRPYIDETIRSPGFILFFCKISKCVCADDEGTHCKKVTLIPN